MMAVFRDVDGIAEGGPMTLHERLAQIRRDAPIDYDSAQRNEYDGALLLSEDDLDTERTYLIRESVLAALDAVCCVLFGCITDEMSDRIQKLRKEVSDGR